MPFFDLAISCSKGTYVRSLCDDIGAALGTGAHLFSLERSEIGPFHIKNSVNLEELGRKDFLESNKRSVYSIDEALSALKEIVLDEIDSRRAQCGVPIKINIIKDLSDCDFVKLKGPTGKLLGIGRIDSDLIRIERILNI